MQTILDRSTTILAGGHDSSLANARRVAPGILVCAGIAVAATGLGRVVPVIGAPVCGIVFGVIAGALLRARSLDRRLQAGIAVSSRTVLQVSIVVLGSGLSLAEIVTTGLSSLPVMLGTLTLALFAAWAAGRALRIDGTLSTLIGVGTGICGASAIAATTAVIDADEAKVSYAVSTIFAFNVVAVLSYPALGHLLGLSQHAFGLWSGTAINDTSSVIAASYTYGHAAGNYGVVVKLTRTLMIIPITLALALWTAHRHAVADGAATAAPRRSADGGAPGRTARWRRSAARLVPWFLIGFVLAAGLNSVGLVPPAVHRPLATASLFMITMALSGIGLSTRPLQLRRAGLRPLVLGAVLWATVGVSSLLLQAIFGMH